MNRQQYTEENPNSFLAFAQERWGDNWAICRPNSAVAHLYDRCITPKEHDRAYAQWRALHPGEWLRENPFAAGAIAAELLAALDRLLSIYDDLYATGCELTEEETAARADALAAIAKARGGTP